ncbi:MAG: acyltransferase [Oxalobacteraceae bacterium]|nr:MAG: acyltransferase [Oxalobacteraceae bacterium]
MTLDKQVSDRIAMIRFIMIVGVVFVHAAADDRISAMGHGWLDSLQIFFSHAAFRTAVPLLALISGYLLFDAKLDLAAVTLWKKKARTIVLPFFFFNCLGIGLFFLLQQIYPDVKMRIDLLHGSRYDWINAFFGIMDVPFNYPLYFVRDLLVLIVLAPVFGWFLRNAPVAGLLLVTMVFYFNYDRYLVIRNTSAIMFYVGGLLAVKQWDLLKLDRYALPMLLSLLGICSAITVFRIDNINYVALSGPFLVWPAFRYLAGTRAGNLASKYNKYSFFIFMAHAPLLQVARSAYAANFQAEVPHGVFWLLAPVAVVTVLIAVYELAMKTAPAPFCWVIGGRVEKKAAVLVERRKTARPVNAAVFSPEMRMALRTGFEGHADVMGGEGYLRRT